MPRKTKEQNEKELKNEITKPSKKSNRASHNAGISSNANNKENKNSTVNKKKSTVNKTNRINSSKTVTAKTTKSTKTSTTTTTRKTKSTVSKSKKATTKKLTAKSKSKSNSVKKLSKSVDTVEYYDLPYRYNQTVVKVLAQTPSTLFIYWDISDSDRKNFEKQYGENFFQDTKPVLIVHNDTLNYSFEVEINDFANSWYLHVADSKCDYRIELGRRPIVKTEQLKNTDYIYVTTSNEMESPNDKILINKEQKMVYFKNIKTGQTKEKPFASLSFITNMGKIYNIYDFYKTIYKNENIDTIYDFNNPSS